MKTLICIMLLIAFALPVQAQTVMEISAFGDLILPIGGDEDTGHEFQVHQAELDLSAAIGEKSTADMAVAYDPGSGLWGLAVLAANYTLADDESLAASLRVGKFDAPFGIDWRSYASVSRKAVTAPLLLEATHEGWNDMGINAHLEKSRLTLDAFLLNGNSCGRGVGTCPVDRPDVNRAFGSRLGYFPQEGWEVGFSSAFFTGPADLVTMSLYGGDLQGTIGPFHLKTEYVLQVADQNSPAEAENTGFYIQGLYDLGAPYLLVRYDTLDFECSCAPSATRWTLGGGYELQEGLELRLEHQAGEQGLPNVTWLQLVMEFGSIQ